MRRCCPALLLLLAALLAGADDDGAQPPPELPALTPADEQRLELPAEMRLAALHGADDPRAALRRCEADDFSLEPLPELHPHVAPRGPHYVDLGFIAFKELDSPFREGMADMSRSGTKCALVQTSTGPVVVRRMMEYPASQRYSQDSEAYRERIGAVRIVADQQRQIEQHMTDAGFTGDQVGAGAAAEHVRFAGGVFLAGSTDAEIDERVAYFARYVAEHVGPPERIRYEDEVQHPVQVGPFALDRREVTVAQYRAFVEATGFRAEPQATAADQGDDWPVVFVSVPDATAYCAWAGGRLPEALEWEFAARGPESRRFPWGPTFPDGTRANFCDSSCERPWGTPDHDDGFARRAPVGSYPAGATPEGLLDMAGNAREWTATLVPDGRAMVKSGGYANAYEDMLPADVRANEWWLRAPDIGFRCAYDVD